MGFLNIKAELFKLIQSVRGTNRASQTKKNSVKDDFLGLQATKNFMLLSRPLIGVQAVCLRSI